MMGSYGGMGMGMGGNGHGRHVHDGRWHGFYGSFVAATATQQAQTSSSRFTELDDAKWEEQFSKLDAEQAEVESKGKGKAKDAETADLLPSEAEQADAIRRELDAIEQELTADGEQANTRFEDLWRSMNARNGVPPSSADAELAKWEEELLKARVMVKMMSLATPTLEAGWEWEGAGWMRWEHLMVLKMRCWMALALSVRTDTLDWDSTE